MILELTYMCVLAQSRPPPDPIPARLVARWLAEVESMQRQVDDIVESIHPLPAPQNPAPAPRPGPVRLGPDWNPF